MTDDEPTANPFGPTRNPFGSPSGGTPLGSPSAGGSPAGPFGPDPGGRQPAASPPGRRSPGGPVAGSAFAFPTDPAASSMASASSGEAVRPPLFWLFGGLIGVLVGALAWLVGDWRLDLLGWLVAITLGLGGVFAFTTADLRLRSNSWYISRQGMVPALRVIVTVGAVLVAGLDAWAFADWFARLDYFA